MLNLKYIFSNSFFIILSSSSKFLSIIFIILSLEYPITDGVLAIVVFGILGYLISLLSYNNHTVEEIVDGEPLILYENEDFNYKNLEDAKFSVSKLLEFCRLKGCFDINELECAILEPSGDVSILLKENEQPITNKDLNRNKKQKLTYDIIVDGVLDEIELKKARKTKKWLNNFLNENKVKVENISLLTISNNKVTLYKRK